MKKFLKEFKEFAMRGNVIDMAVGIIIGGAFTAIVNSLIENFIQPLLDLIVPKLEDGSVGFMGNVMNFVGAVINFIVTAFVLFLIIKAMNRMKDMKKKDEKPAAPTTKECPFCFSEINIKATRCPCCAAELKKVNQ